MPRIVSRAPKTPRKIRDLRPQRQQPSRGHARGRRHDGGDVDGDGWYRPGGSGGGGGEDHARRRGAVAAAHRPGQPAAPPTRDTESLEKDVRRRGACVRMRRACEQARRAREHITRAYDRFRQLPRRQRRKRFCLGLVLVTAWRTLYLADLDQYARYGAPRREGKGNLRSLPALDDEFPSLQDASSDGSLQDEFSDGTTSSLFGKAQPKWDLPSSLTKIDHAPLEAAGQIPKTRFVAESVGLGANGYAADGAKSFGSSHVAGPLQQLSGIRSKQEGQQINNGAKPFGLFPSDAMEKETPLVANMPQLSSWANPKRGAYQSSQGNLQLMPQSNYGSDGGLKYQNLIRDSGDWTDARQGQQQSSLGDARSMEQGAYDNQGGVGMPARSMGTSGLVMQSAIHANAKKDATFPGDAKGNAFSNGPGRNMGGPLGNPHSMDREGASPVRSMEQVLAESGSSGGSNVAAMNHAPQFASRRPGARLDCAARGGSPPAEAADVVYWRDVPADASFASSYYNARAQEATSSAFWQSKYLTFEMDDGGWNNMRLGEPWVAGSFAAGKPNVAVTLSTSIQTCNMIATFEQTCVS